MSLPFSTEYPVELTNAAWQKKKTFKDKLKSKTKTGLGATLIAAEKAWKNIPFAKLDADKQAGGNRGARPYPQVQANREAAKEILAGQVAVAEKALLAASRKASALASNAALSPGALAAAKELASATQRQAVLLKQIKLKEFDDEIREGLQVQRQGAQEYKSRVRLIRNTVEGLRRTPSAENWNRSVEVLEKEVFLAYHFVITSVDTLNLPDYKPMRPMWSRVDEQLGRAKPLVKAALAQEHNDNAVREAVLNFTRAVHNDLARL